MRAALLTAAALLAGVPASAAGASRHAEPIAEALHSDPVYVAPARADDLDVAARGSVRIRIAESDPGRIKIALVPAKWAADAGGVRALANAIDAELAVRGALLVQAPGDAHIVTSHPRADRASLGVQEAFDHNDGLANQLLRSVNAMAEADPGESADARPPGVTTLPSFPGADKIVDTVSDGIQLTFLVLILAIISPVLWGTWALWRNFRRDRAEDEDLMEDARAAAEAERVALGDDIVDLDAATSMPNVAPAARTAYERALDAYEKSELALRAADTPRRIAAAAKLIADGRANAASAREATGASG